MTNQARSGSFFYPMQQAGLPDVMCLLVDVALLSRAERLYLWGSSGGVDLWCRIERERLNLPSRHVFRSMLAPQGC